MRGAAQSGDPSRPKKEVLRQLATETPPSPAARAGAAARDGRLPARRRPRSLINYPTTGRRRRDDDRHQTSVCLSVCRRTTMQSAHGGRSWQGRIQNFGKWCANGNWDSTSKAAVARCQSQWLVINCKKIIIG